MIQPFYRTIAPFLFRAALGLKGQGSSWNKRLAWRNAPKGSNASTASETVRPVWIHFASEGEWESVSPVVERLLEQEVPLVLTHFSASPEASLARFYAALSGPRQRLILYLGFAPPEGLWLEALRRLSPTHLLTVKYEVWPELWGSLSVLNIPLWVLGSSDRGSLASAPKLVKRLGFELPRLRFLGSNETANARLEALFPSAVSTLVGDPRWERVEKKLKEAKAGSSRTQLLVQALAVCPRPWRVIGNAWKEDLHVLLEGSDRLLAQSSALQGTLWVVPRRIQGADFEAVVQCLEGFTQSHSLKLLRSSEVSSSAHQGSPHVVLVDEFGVLLELYGHADLCYVGGGFGAGIHSTIEPAFSGKPVLSGTARAGRFTETGELVASGQLTLFEDASALRAAFWSAPQTSNPAWSDVLTRNHGASLRIAEALLAERPSRVSLQV